MPRPISCVMLCILCLLSAGCGMFPMSSDHPALYTFPTGKRVLVFVDFRPNVSVPPELSAQIGQKISDHLFQHHAVEHVVLQARLTELKKDPEKFSKLGLADIARLTDADLILHVDVITFQVSTISDESMTDGLAQALVKVVDSKGMRYWPPVTSMGAAYEIHIAPALSEQPSRLDVQRQLVDLMTVRIGRSFHKYSSDDAELNR